MPKTSWLSSPGRRRARVVDGVEVVDVVPAHDQQKASKEHLDAVRWAVEVPDGRSRPEAHRQVKP